MSLSEWRDVAAIAFYFTAIIAIVLAAIVLVYVYLKARCEFAKWSAISRNLALFLEVVGAFERAISLFPRLRNSITGKGMK